jgi:hypothetical protein
MKLARYLFAAASMLMVLFSVSPAKAVITIADPWSCLVADVGWDSRLYIDCVGVSTRFFVYSSINCPSGTITHSIDDMKMFQSLATSALLSGKTLSINFNNNCEGVAGTNVGPVYNMTLLR